MNHRRRRKLAWLAVGVGSAAAAATVVGVRHYRKKLDTEASRISEILGVTPGATLAEVGAGKGQMTVRVARRMQAGRRVVSTEFEPRRVRHIRHSVQKSGLNNISVMQGSETGAELPSDTCDAIFMRGVYHHFTTPHEMNRSLFRALRAGGRLAVIDFPPKLLLSLWTPKGIPANRGGHGIKKELLLEEVTQAGFQPVREYDEWPSCEYCVLFRKPA